MSYLFLFVFLASEWHDHQPVVFFSLFITSIIAVASLVLVEYEGIMRQILLYVGLGLIAIFLVVDMAAWASPRQLRIFSLPVILEALLFGGAVLLLFFQVPERWCRDTRAVQLYLCSQVIYTILLINFLFELQSIIYYLIKSNDGDLKDEESWWKLKNMYE